MLQTGISLQEAAVAAGVVVALVIVLAVFGMWQAFRAHVDHHGLIPVLWRWFSGSHHHKRDPYSRLSPDRYRKHCLRRLPGRMRRVMWRSFFVFALPWGLLVYFLDTPGLWFITSLVTLAMATEGVRHNILTLLWYRHHREYVVPLAESLRAVLHPEAMPDNAGDWVYVDRDYRGEPLGWKLWEWDWGQIARFSEWEWYRFWKREDESDEFHPHWAIVDLPRYWNGSEKHKERVVSIIKETCNMDSNASVTWTLHARNSRVKVNDLQPPPRHVTLNDILPEIEKKAAEDGPLLKTITIGLGRASIPVNVSLAMDSPNIGLSMGAGAGKSQFCRLVAAQVLHRGGVVVVLDVKRISHAWARDLPNVRYARDIAEIHEMLLDISHEVNRRTKIADHHSDYEGNLSETIKWPRWLIIVEESNEMMARLRRYWQETRDPRKDPVQSPAISAYEECLFMGRQLLMNMLAVAQMMTARASGSGAARENMGIRVLGRFSRNAWRMLVPEFEQPERSMHPGRVQVVTNDVRECQVAYMTAAEARDYATNGDVTPFPKIVRDGAEIDDTGDPDVVEGEVVSESDLGDPSQEHAAIMPPSSDSTWISPDHDPYADPDWAPLRAALEALPGKTIDMLRNDSKRDPDFPKPHPNKRGRDNMYPVDDVVRYYHEKARRKGRAA